MNARGDIRRHLRDNRGKDKVVPVDVYIPGCPPRPEAILYGLLLAVDRISPEIKEQDSEQV